ncbi:hypothetical protein PF002_g18642 [Phytophthora fragariae]|uniref:Uncharacterized protein n=1 Tax=Phytophthora fragariae TaxID=53985 RepID=A0A6A4BPF0_9STRA|nr:hypothetical protein PF003_g36149 [Phytophthora fragariae]KAE9211070.1 hypothetical protein PF002_g18642 [Phytophthora fragariae]KAE9276340.1 hypothetical protein PF001_g26172 [Phytophthora fragariae]
MARENDMNVELWAFLSDVFEERVGISGEVLLDSTVDEEDEETATKDQGASKQKAPPVVQLATALQGGVEAIAASLGSRSTADENLRSLAELLQQQQDENCRFQEMQLQLLKELGAQRKEWLHVARATGCCLLSSDATIALRCLQYRRAS